ncbi:MAG: NAD(P)-dependent oxidoreductase [Armatimonadetes bacterium]|nr:NAD(P)-dependent oxidoreductase [Armatimonadota bacterium]
MKIAIYGAGGPVAASAIAALEGRHELRLTDLKPLETSHASLQVDVTDPDQVRVAAEGMDVLINCTVLRDHPVIAFDVNTRGAYNVMQAALACGIPRVIHTGPGIHLGPRSYGRDFDVTEAAPPRVGANLYAVSKFLGWEIVRTFCRRHPEVSVVAFFYSGFHTGDITPQGWIPDWNVDSRDAGQAFRLGAEIARDKLPSNCELFNINADLPVSRISIEKARRILGYEPQHNFEVLWSRKARAAWDAEHPPAEG